MFQNCVLKTNVNTCRWFRAALIRAVKTMAQTAAAVIGTCNALSSVDWKMALSAAVLSGILSILTSIAGIPEAAGTDSDDPLYETFHETP